MHKWLVRLVAAQLHQKKLNVRKGFSARSAPTFAATPLTVAYGLFASMLSYGREAAFQKGVVIAVTAIADPDGSP